MIIHITMSPMLILGLKSFKEKLKNWATDLISSDDAERMIGKSIRNLSGWWKH
jgi:hypothetical protein